MLRRDLRGGCGEFLFLGVVEIGGGWRGRGRGFAFCGAGGAWNVRGRGMAGSMDVIGCVRKGV